MEKLMTLEDLTKAFTGMELDAITPEHLLRMMQRAGTYYVSVRDPATHSLQTPLVGYAGRDGAGKQLVGHEYFNFGKGEEYPVLIWSFAARLFHLYQQYLATLGDGEYDSTVAGVICGMPMGGLHPAFCFTTLYRQLMSVEPRYIHAEKVTLAATDGGKRKSRLEFGGRHEAPGKNEQVAVCEDVCNNMQTTADGIQKVEEGGGRVTLILCCVNAGVHETHFPLSDGRRIPILAAVRRSFPSFPQDDPSVAAEIARGNVRFDTRHHWRELIDAMHTARKR